MKPGDKLKQRYTNLFYCPFCQDSCIIYGQEYWCGLTGFPETDALGVPTGLYVVKGVCSNYCYFLEDVIEIKPEETISLANCICESRDLFWFGCRCGGI